MKMESIERKISVRDQPTIEESSRRKKHTDYGFGFPITQEQEDSEKDFLKDTDKMLAQRFKVYDLCLKDIQNILTYWDRKQGLQMPHAGMEEVPHEPDDQRQAPSGGGGRRGRKDRERERLEKERAEKERLEREKAERERLEKLRALEERSDEVEGEVEEEHEGKKDLGVPFISIHTPDFEGTSWKQALESDKLPKGDQVQRLLWGKTK